MTQVTKIKSNEKHLISLKNAGVKRNGTWLVKNISFDIHKGEIITMIGPNGSGKSTSAKMALGIIKPDSGSVERVLGLKIGYVPQKIDIDWTFPLSVGRFMHLSGKIAQHDIDEALKNTGISHLSNAQLRSLSGGEFARALLARAIARKPDLLVLDEPVQGVDYNGEIELYQLISKIRNDLGCAILMISHNLHVVMATTDRVICLNGHICCQGEPNIVTKSQEYMQLFGAIDEKILALYQHHHDHEHNLDGHICDSEGENCSKERKVKSENE
jgi:zinc transport system ATP-binding protein